MSSDQIRQTLSGFLASVSTLSLATVDDLGLPCAANVNFVADPGLRLYFISHPDSNHSRHILARPDVAATAYAAFVQPAEIRGVQVRGTCRAISSEEFDSVWNLFRDKFSYASQFEHRARSEQFYRLSPAWFRYIDNSVGFGHKWETHWPPAG